MFKITTSNGCLKSSLVSIIEQKPASSDINKSYFIPSHTTNTPFSLFRGLLTEELFSDYRVESAEIIFKRNKLYIEYNNIRYK